MPEVKGLMQRSNVYLALAVVGALVPWFYFARFFAAHGLGGNFVGSLFANDASGGFTIDLLISSLAFWTYLFREASVRGIQRPWVYLVVNLLIGLSCALPLFLWARERAAILPNWRETGETS